MESKEHRFDVPFLQEISDVSFRTKYARIEQNVKRNISWTEL